MGPNSPLIEPGSISKLTLSTIVLPFIDFDILLTEHYSVNDESGDVAANRKVINDNDVVEWLYTDEY